MAADVLEQLFFLCRAAAEAGEDWRARLEQEWLPQLLASDEENLRRAMLAWTGRTPSQGKALVSEALEVLTEAMGQAGYF
ncbi:MAG: hypothetical protein ACUVRE_08955 [Thermoanaerobaculaceae bacterium]